jgi:hypothetical protein
MWNAHESIMRNTHCTSDAFSCSDSIDVTWLLRIKPKKGSKFRYYQIRKLVASLRTATLCINISAKYLFLNVNHDRIRHCWSMST